MRLTYRQLANIFSKIIQIWTNPMKNTTILFLCFSICFQAMSAQSRSLENSSTCPNTNSFSFSDPSTEGLDINRLIALTRWLETSKEPVLSLLISHNGRLVYEAYTGGRTRNEAHYVMSVTKSVTSALVGAALRQGLIASIDEPLTKVLPQRYFPTVQQRDRMGRITLRNALAMSALDARVAPHLATAEGISRQQSFFNARDRLAFALSQNTLNKPGEDFQYTDVTTSIQGGVVQYLTGKTLLDYSKDVLFDPLSFNNADWMHQDGSGQEMAAYGLRLRPIDMQKFGILYLNKGCWNGQRLLDATWIDESTRGWIRSYPKARVPNYGLGWWMIDVDGHGGYEANGWKGQRIMVFPDDKLVVTATAIIEHDEGSFYPAILRNYILPSLGSPSSRRSDKEIELVDGLKRLNEQPSRVPQGAEYRMIPEIKMKEQRSIYRNRLQ